MDSKRERTSINTLSMSIVLQWFYIHAVRPFPHRVFISKLSRFPQRLRGLGTDSSRILPDSNLLLVSTCDRQATVGAGRSAIPAHQLVLLDTGPRTLIEACGISLEAKNSFHGRRSPLRMNSSRPWKRTLPSRSDPVTLTFSIELTPIVVRNSLLNEITVRN